jgi:nitrogen regulatory protein P-II 1
MTWTKPEPRPQWARVSRYYHEFVPRARIELVAEDAAAERLVASIARHAKTGADGDGVIWVSPVDYLLHVRTSDFEREQAAAS